MPRHLVRWWVGPVIGSGPALHRRTLAVVIVELVIVGTVASGYLIFVAGRRSMWAAPTSWPWVLIVELVPILWPWVLRGMT